MKKIFLLAMVIISILCLTSCTQSYNETAQTNQNTDAATRSDDTKINSGIDHAPLYAEDSVVNRFITEFNQKSAYEITDISKGHIRTKYFGYANGRYLEMTNANNAVAEEFFLRINGGQEIADKQAMYEVFRNAIKVLEPSISDDIIDKALTEFDNKDVLIEDYSLCDSISVTYVPIKELSYGKNSCRIDISASNYK